MRYRLMATYCGAPYQAGLGPDGTEVTLFAACPPPEELGFSCAAGHWRKQVDISDLDALWQSRPVGDYRGDPCLVLDDLGDRLHIVYLGRDAVLARQLGYWEVDREVFEVVVPRHEVTDLAEERAEIPLAAATFPPSGAEPHGVAPSAAPRRRAASTAQSGVAPRNAAPLSTAQSGVAPRSTAPRSAGPAGGDLAEAERPGPKRPGPERSGSGRAGPGGPTPGGRVRADRGRASLGRRGNRRGGSPIARSRPCGGVAWLARTRLLVRARA